LAEYQTFVEELDDIEHEEEKGLLLNDALEEVEEGPDEGEMLVIRAALPHKMSLNKERISFTPRAL